MRALPSGCQGHLPVFVARNWKSQGFLNIQALQCAKMAQVLGRGLKSKFAPGATLLRRVVVGITQNECPALSRPGQWTPVATLIPTHGEKYAYKKPWDYRNKPFNMLYQAYDSTKARLNPNSKVIIVEGNAAVGKNDFAKRLAHNFDMLYVPSVPEMDCFLVEQNGFDRRKLDEFLPKHLQHYDLGKFYSDPNPKSGRIGNLQLEWYRQRYLMYCQAVLHLLSTGQGVVISQSVFGDYAYVKAMRTMGYVTRNFVDYYDDIHSQTIMELLRPHITIYLDAPVNILRQRIKERKDPREQSQAVLSDKYLEAITDGYRSLVLPELRVTGELIEVDWTEKADDLEMDVIVEELANLHLEVEDREDPKFMDWEMDEDHLANYRKAYSIKPGQHVPMQVDELFSFDPPLNCPEILLQGEDLVTYQEVVHMHPAIHYSNEWSEALGYAPRWRL